MACSHDGSSCIFTDPTLDYLLMFRQASRSVDTVLGNLIFSTRITRDGSRVYVACFRQVSVYETQSFTERQRLSFGNIVSGIGINLDASLFAVCVLNEIAIY